MPSPAGHTNIDFIEAVLQGYGTPYDVVALDASVAADTNFTSLLWAPDGVARYAGYFMYPNVRGVIGVIGVDEGVDEEGSSR